MRHIFKNRLGTVRSGWLIAICEGSNYALTWAATFILFAVLRAVLTWTGDLDPVTDAGSPLVNWLDETGLPVILQILSDVLMIAVPLAMWRIMRYRYGELGLKALRGAPLRDGLLGLALGFFNCTLIFCVLLLTGNCAVTSAGLRISPMWLAWVFALVLVGVAEEVMNRGFIMSVLRRANRPWVIMLVPSLIFGMMHLANPGVTALSVVNIVLAGILFSYMYYKSGHLWMGIGYHITWNIFQSTVYGMPCSGLVFPSLVSCEYPAANLLNGGAFGIEGGLLTTLVQLLTLAAVHLYYRNSGYRFLPSAPQA